MTQKAVGLTAGWLDEFPKSTSGAVGLCQTAELQMDATGTHRLLRIRENGVRNSAISQNRGARCPTVAFG